MPETVTIKGMHVGEQSVQTDEELTFCKQMGVEYVSMSPLFGAGEMKLGLDEKGHWNTNTLTNLREYIESFGLRLAAMRLPLVHDYIDKQRWSSIMLGSPERERDIENACKCIEATGRAGIPILLYSLSVLPVLRSPGRTPGRGGITYTFFNYEEVKDDHPYVVGPVSYEQSWERIDYFIKRVIPVAEEYGVKMACHPNDMPVPPNIPYRGITPFLNSVDELKRFIDLYPSPYHGIVFCQGTLSEMSTNPEQVYEAIRYFGKHKRIFWVHFRNIHGGFLKFVETFPDDGDIDMLKAMRTYKEVDYNGVLIPDHVPEWEIAQSRVSYPRAYCLGYLKALIQAVELENQEKQK